MPSRCSNINASRAPGSMRDVLSFQSMRRTPGPACRASTAAPAPSPNKQALINTPGSLSKYIAALLTSTQIDRTWSQPPPTIRALPSIRLGSAAAQPWPTRSKASTSARKPRRSTTCPDKPGHRYPVQVLTTTASICRAGNPALLKARSPACAASSGAWVPKRCDSVFGSIVKTSSNESTAMRRASMPLSRWRTVLAMKWARSSSRENQADCSNASRHSAFV